MEDTATLRLGNQNYNFPVVIGSEQEIAIDLRHLREVTGAIALDEGYANTGSCFSDITFIDGEAGILRHRGYPIEELAERSHFLETAYLIIYGQLPTKNILDPFCQAIKKSALLHEDMRGLFSAFPTYAHPMGMLSSLLNGIGAYSPHLTQHDKRWDSQIFDETVIVLLGKIRTLAAWISRRKQGLPMAYPDPEYGYIENFLHMLFSKPNAPYIPLPEITQALDLILLLHADHEQNCSTSTVRMVASGGANAFTSIASGISALWGPLHGGANMAVIQMLQDIYDSGDNGHAFIDAVKAGSGRLMGFGHRVYKNYDPRAKIMKVTCEKVLRLLGHNDPLLDIARKLEEEALRDDYFVSRKLYPHVDFYSGIILRAIGIPLDLFTVIFAMGRTPGWLANWKEVASASKGRIYRPRQIYTGATLRSYEALADRK
jgi:citrate synthase